MIVEYLRYTIEEARQSEFVQDYAAASKPLLESPHAVSFDLCQCSEDSSQFILRIEWTSADDHLKGFRGSDAFKTFFSHVRSYVSDIDEMRHYQRILPA